MLMQTPLSIVFVLSYMYMKLYIIWDIQNVCVYLCVCVYRHWMAFLLISIPLYIESPSLEAFGVFSSYFIQSPHYKSEKNFPEMLNDLPEVIQQVKGSVDG